MKPFARRAWQRFIYDPNDVQLIDVSRIEPDPELIERNRRKAREAIDLLGPAWVLHNPKPPQHAANDGDANESDRTH